MSRNAGGHTGCPGQGKAYFAPLHESGRGESWFRDRECARYRAKIRGAALYRAGWGALYRDTDNREVVSGMNKIQ